MKFRRQHVVEGFVVDFYCDEHKIAIEVDGGIHNNRLDYDNAREDVIRSEGITLVRIKNEDVLRLSWVSFRHEAQYSNMPCLFGVTWCASCSKCTSC